MADEISVSMHIGSGKNAINNMDKIKRADLHNNRKYKNNKNEQIDLSLSKYNITLAGTKNITEDIKNFYKSEFAEVVYKYNQKQEREDRKIVNYLEKMNNDTKTNIAVEFIFQIGDKQDWEEVSIEDKAKTKDIFEKAIGILEKRGIKTVNASLHLDETSPHLHLIAVPIVENQKRGLEKQVSQNKVITKSLLKVIRKEVEEIFIQEYNKIYGTSKELKKGCEIEEHLSVEDYKDTKKILEVAKKVGDRKEFKRELDINLSELDEDLKKLKEELETKKEEQSKLTRLEKELDIVIKEQKRVKEEKEKEIADLQENVKSKEELEKDLLEIKNEVDKINESVEFKKEELESAKNSLNAIQNNIEKQYLLENQLKDKINEYNRINEELKTKTIEVKEIEEKVKANDEIMSVYKTKINSFDDDLEKIKKEAEEKEKKIKEEEEKTAQIQKEAEKTNENIRRIEADFQIKKKEEKEYQDKLDKTREKIKELEKDNNTENAKLNELINKEKEFNVNGLVVSTYAKDFVQEAVKEGITDIVIYSSPDDIKINYYKGDNKVELKNSIFYNGVGKYYKAVLNTLGENQFVYNLKSGKTILQTKTEDINFKNSGIFNIINILNNEKIEEIIDLNYKVSKGKIKDEEMKKIEKQIGYNIEKEPIDNDEKKF
ncbi:plasmid recombination protein [Fusobacterium nucleatum]|uniref:plasmid recombination protein n=1 Tax=Fusobacterium nucleatum TaxID=851 RepID=UPI0030CAF62C